MKKSTIVCVIIAFALLLTACSGNASNGGAGGAKQGAGAGASSEEKKSEKQHSTDELGRIFSATIEETVLVDEKGVKITAKGLTYTYYSAELELLLENNSDRNLTFLSETLGYSINSVNGYMMPIGFISEEIAAGMNSSQTISIAFDELSMYGILDIADIGLGFEIKDGYDDYLKTGAIKIKTSAAGSYDYSKDTFAEAMDGAIVPSVYEFSVDYRGTDKLLDDYGLTIEKEYVITNKDGDKNLIMEVVSHSKKDLYIVEDNVCVNGMSVSTETWDSEAIAAGKRALLTLELKSLLDPSFLELLGMKKYTDCSMTLNIMDGELNTVGSKKVTVSFDGTSSPEQFAGEIVYENNGYTFRTVGIVNDSSEISDDVHVLVLVQNASGNDVYVSTGFNDVYANKTKVSDITYGRTVKDGAYGLIDIELSGYDLKDKGLDASTITEVSTKFELGDGSFTTFDEPEVTMKFGK